MGWFDSADSHPRQDDYNQVQNWGNGDFEEKHKASKLDEVLAGGASYAAARKYENTYDPNGNHKEAKEVLAGFAGAFVDHEFESRGLDFIDSEKAKYGAKKAARQQVQDDYNQQHNLDGSDDAPYDPNYNQY